MVFVGSNWRATGSYGMGAAAADFDNDGWPDIYVACDTAPSLLYRNNHDGTFREIAVPAGARSTSMASLLRAWARASAITTGTAGSISCGPTSPSRSPRCTGTMSAARSKTPASGRPRHQSQVRRVRRRTSSISTTTGGKDIFIANGHVYSQLADRKLHISYRQPRLLYRNLGNGRFEDVSAKAVPRSRRRTSAEAARSATSTTTATWTSSINNLDGPPTLLRNDGGNRNNWLLVKCVGTRSNRRAIGARVRVTVGGRARSTK